AKLNPYLRRMQLDMDHFVAVGYSLLRCSPASAAPQSEAWARSCTAESCNGAALCIKVQLRRKRSPWRKPGASPFARDKWNNQEREIVRGARPRGQTFSKSCTNAAFFSNLEYLILLNIFAASPMRSTTKAIFFLFNFSELRGKQWLDNRSLPYTSR